MQPYFFIHLKQRYVRIAISSIQYVLSVAHPINLVTDKGVFIPHLSLKQLERILPAGTFCRVNRGALVKLDRIVSYEKDAVNLKDV